MKGFIQLELLTCLHPFMYGSKGAYSNLPSVLL